MATELTDIHHVTDILYEYGVLEPWVLSKHPLQYKIICPYHDETAPSCDVKLATGMIGGRAAPIMAMLTSALHGYSTVTRMHGLRCTIYTH